MTLNLNILLDPVVGPHVVLTEFWPGSDIAQQPSTRVGFGQHGLRNLTHGHLRSPSLNYFAAWLLETLPHRLEIAGLYESSGEADRSDAHRKLIEGLRPDRKQPQFWADIFGGTKAPVSVSRADIDPASAHAEERRRQSFFSPARSNIPGKVSMELLDPWKGATVRLVLHESIDSVSGWTTHLRGIMPVLAAGAEVLFVPASGNRVTVPELWKVISGLRSEPLAVTAEAWVRKGRQGPYQRVPTHQSDGRIPLGEDDALRLKVEVNRPAFIYVMGIDENGDLTPFHPWQASEGWGDRTVGDRDQPGASFLIGLSTARSSDGGPEGIAFEGSHAIQCGFVVLATEKALQLKQLQDVFAAGGVPLGWSALPQVRLVPLTERSEETREALTAPFRPAPDGGNAHGWLAERIADLAPDAAQLLLVPFAPQARY